MQRSGYHQLFINRDFAFSAESGTVWMYETDWYNSGDIVPDQVTPASDAIPSNSVVNGKAGVSNEYARGDHQHPLQVSTFLPAKDTANGETGVANTYARSEHAHHVNLSNDVPLKNTRATTKANGISDFYSKNDHDNPQQLTYDGNITATKFIKTGGTVIDTFLADGKTKKIIIPSANGTFNEGIRISRNQINQWSNIQFGSDPNSNSGKIDNQWLVGSTGNNGANPLGFVIVKAGQEDQTDRGLLISADGNILTFNGQVIASGSVNHSQVNPIVWNTKSLGTDGGFYSDGTTVFLRDHALQFDPNYQNQ
ncbi:MAG: hypothetical protein EZS28_011625 [Streblomastix strix]|uniref:Uncharacterized protein n=1 Tax=Streblomastix strix TaxID=222440 RepID=A0A5J4WD47_9EUKA|nr:MAG: hypothetical protein EZS28_011625 [Streblomastix strix]